MQPVGKSDQCVVLFSGGTDSCCAAYLACEKYSTVHLLTFFEKATQNSPIPKDNVERLRTHFPNVNIVHHLCNIDATLKELSYKNYFSNLIKYHYFNLATPGLSSLSWHIHSMAFCRERKIETVYDGMTKELMHLPGHMVKVRRLFAEYYASAGINFSSPVIEWDVPADRQFVDQLIVDMHEKHMDEKRTTGEFLYSKNFFDKNNIKGRQIDFEMQHDCYPFIVYNILYFWLFRTFMSAEKIENKLVDFFSSKMKIAVEISNLKLPTKILS